MFNVVNYKRLNETKHTINMIYTTVINLVLCVWKWSIILDGVVSLLYIAGQYRILNYKCTGVLRLSLIVRFLSNTNFTILITCR